MKSYQLAMFAALLFLSTTVNAQLSVSVAGSAFDKANLGATAQVGYKMPITQSLAIEPMIGVQVRQNHLPAYLAGARLSTGGERFRLYALAYISNPANQIKPFRLKQSSVAGGFGGEYKLAKAPVSLFGEVAGSTATNSPNISVIPQVNAGVRVSFGKRKKVAENVSKTYEIAPISQYEKTPAQLRETIYRDSQFVTDLQAAIQQNLRIMGNMVWTLDSIRQVEYSARADSFAGVFNRKLKSLGKDPETNKPPIQEATLYFPYGEYEVSGETKTRFVNEAETLLNKWGYTFTGKLGYTLFSDKAKIRLIITGYASDEGESPTFSNAELAKDRANSALGYLGLTTGLNMEVKNIVLSEKGAYKATIRFVEHTSTR
jgi:hypothetical protein